AGRSPLLLLLLDADAHGIDAGRRPEVVAESDVGGREADRAPPLLAVLDGSVDLPPVAEEARRLLQAAVLEVLADPGRGVLDTVLADDARHLGDAEAVTGRQPAQQLRRPAAVAAEVEVLADDGVPDREIARQNLVDERLGGVAGELAVEREHEQEIGAERLGQPRPGARSGEHTAGLPSRE